MNFLADAIKIGQEDELLREYFNAVDTVDTEIFRFGEMVLLLYDWDVVLRRSWRWPPLVGQHVVDVPEGEIKSAYALGHR